MTIKQYGGVFGRNPTFNDVTIEGQLTFDGDIDINSDLTVDGTVTAEEIIVDSGASYSSYIKTTNDSSNVTLNIWGNRSSGTGSSSPDVRLGSEQVRSAGRDVVQIRNNSTDIATFDAGGDVTISAGNLVIGTSGKGIDFSATAGSGTSELLSDYEEGVFTPTYSTTGTDFTSVTYDSGSTEGSYTKIGNMVNVRISMRTSAVTIGSASGTVLISGLPFTASSNKNATGCYGSLFAGDNPRVGRAVGTTVYLYYRTAGNTGDIPLAPADLGTGANNNDVIISLSYQTS